VSVFPLSNGEHRALSKKNTEVRYGQPNFTFRI